MEIKIMKRKFNRKGLFLTVLGIGFIIVSVMMNMAVPNIHHARASARLKACFSNQRVIQGAVEMYNIDNKDNKILIETALPGNAYADVEELLIENGYLKDNIHLYEPDCSYGFIDINASGTVFCKKHGSLELYDINSGNITLPSYDASLEMPLSQKNLEKRNKRIREREMKDFKYMLSNILSAPIIGILLGVALIAVDIFGSKKKEESVD